MGFLEAPNRQDKVAFSQYRAIAWATGVVLAVMTVYLVAVYAFGVEQTHIYQLGWRLHGVLYIVYLAFVARITIRERWQMPQTVMVAISGTVPLWGIFMERKLSAARQSATSA